jgi:hypothetical protein
MVSKDKQEQAYALRMAIIIGCSGAHQDENGKWHPCKSMEEMERLSDAAENDSWYGSNSLSSLRKRDVRASGKSALVEASKRGEERKPKRKKNEKLNEKPLSGIGTLPSGGLYGIRGKAIPVSSPRDNDPDVFMEPESARSRSRQLGCIGISRRTSRNGRTVWTPCTNMSDYARLAGTTALGRRGQQAEMRRGVRTIVNDELKRRKLK